MSGPQPRIHKLPSALIDQIAAGEVVERAASVVKELCENSLDAGARRVDVELTDGGRTSIRIVDDGSGMTPEEARLSLTRHATSKITNESDLWGVQTFGFRGEALPSIASVSRLCLQTRVPEAAEGFLLRVEAGIEVESRACGIPQGTQIEVRDLFFNTPARLKFQKTEATESGNVSEALMRLAVANPDVHFRLRMNGRVAMDLPPHRDLSERVRAALARRGAGVLHEAVGHENGVAVHAFLAGPECASTTSRNTFLFVGRRFVRDRSLLQAVCMGYGESIEKGRYPLAVLFVDVAGEEIDVNVHPQKMEVRFAQPQPVYAAVRHVLQDGLARAPWLSQSTARAYSLPPTSLSKGGMRLADSAGPLKEPARARPSSPPVHDFDRVFSAPLSQPSSPLKPQYPALTFVGALAPRFLIFQEADLGMLLVDRQAAVARIELESFQALFAQGALHPEPLLFPIPVELDERTLAGFGAVQEPLRQLGFDVDVFGSEALLVRGVPGPLSKTEIKPLLLEVLARLSEGQGSPAGGDALSQALASMANRSAMSVSLPMDPQAAVALMVKLDRIGGREPQASGGAVVVRVSAAEVERRFERP